MLFRKWTVDLSSHLTIIPLYEGADFVSAAYAVLGFGKCDQTFHCCLAGEEDSSSIKQVSLCYDRPLEVIFIKT